jgi:hypothetical protein
MEEKPETSKKPALKRFSWSAPQANGVLNQGM